MEDGRPRKYRRRKFPLLWIVVGVAVSFLLFYASYVYLNWVILETMYQAKSGLDWFGITFYNGLTFIVSGLLALLLINPIPQKSDLMDAFNALVGIQGKQPWRGRDGGYSEYEGSGPDHSLGRLPTIRPGVALWIFWQMVKWVAGFLLFVQVSGFLGLGNITIPLLMAAKGYGDWSSLGKILLLAAYPVTGGQLVLLMPAMEIQYRIVSYFLVSALVVVAVRFFLKFVRDAVRRAGDKWIRNLLFSLASVLMIEILEAPYWPMDITTPYIYGIVLTIFSTFLVFGLFFHLKSGREAMTMAQRRRTGILIAASIIGVILVVNVGIIGYYRINWNNGWINYEWGPLTSKQIAVTRWAAGLQGMNYTSLKNIPSGNATAALNLVRQWDGNASYIQSTNKIGVNWMQLVTQSEIVYVNNHEYWATPTTFAPVASDWISNHLIYTHTSKIMVIDSHTGNFVPSTKAFNVPVQPLIYYGERFTSDAYVNVPNAPSEIENASYSGTPDYVLSGWQRSLWFLVHEGQLGYAFSPPSDTIKMLHEKDVFQRVSNLLIYGLQHDQSTYLVSDNKTLYYCIQLYVDYPLHSGYSTSDYLRFFGVVLVNVVDGSLKGFTVAKDDDFFSSFYKSYYKSWVSPPSWLTRQLRYPEQLLGNQTSPGQLDIDFSYHVNSSSVWRSQQDFFARPGTTEVLYVPIAINNSVYFTAIQLVEFKSSSGKNLAGLYVIYGGDRLGQMTLYQANSTVFGSTPLIGPSAALQAFKTVPWIKQQITFTNATTGNALPYLIAGDLFYFIPVYSNTGSQPAIITNLAFMGVVDAASGLSAHSDLNNTNTSTDSSQAFYFLSGVSSLFGPQNRTAALLKMFPPSYVLSRVTAVHPTVENKTYVVNFTSPYERNQTQTVVNSFITNYVNPILNATSSKQLIWWTPDSSTVDVGFLVSTSGIIWLYYVEVNVGNG